MQEGRRFRTQAAAFGKQRGVCKQNKEVVMGLWSTLGNGAAGSVIGGIVGGPVGAVVGGAMGAHFGGTHTVFCPHCGAEFEVKNNNPSTTFRCGVCHKTFDA